MELLFKISLFLHIFSGITGFFTGIASLATQKGGSIHVKTGIVFYYAMLTVALSSFILAVLHPNPFLFAVGIFTLYTTLSGRRFLTQKQKGLMHQTDSFEKILATLMAFFSLVFFVLAINFLLSQQYFGIVFLAFSFGTARFVISDYNYIQGKNITPLFWLRMHIVRMTSAWIAAVTAAVVVNGDKISSFVGSDSVFVSIFSWLAPGLIGSFLIVYWLRKMKA